MRPTGGDRGPSPSAGRKVANGRRRTEEKKGKGAAAYPTGGCAEAPPPARREQAQGRRRRHPDEDEGAPARLVRDRGQRRRGKGKEIEPVS